MMPNSCSNTLTIQHFYPPFQGAIKVLVCYLYAENIATLCISSMQGNNAATCPALCMLAEMYITGLHNAVSVIPGLWKCVTMQFIIYASLSR